MGFLDRKAEKSSNPASKFLEWKSNDQHFAYYDKEAKTNVPVPLPLKFIVMEEYHTVKGFSDKDQTGIYANEVLHPGTDPLTVKTFKGREIASGIYKEIRNEIRDAGGVYHKSIYAMLPEGELVNISIKGSVVSEWSDFIGKGAWKRLKDEWVTVAAAEKRKKGATTYHVPIFKFDGSLADTDWDKAKECATELSEYMDGYLKHKAEPTPELVTIQDDFEDLESLAF